MKKILAVTVIFLCCITITFGQKGKKRTAGMLVDKRKPAVFISFVNQKEFKSDDDIDERKRFFFRITNNTRSSIWIQMSGEREEYGQASLYYAIEDKWGNRISGSTSCHVCSINLLHSGRSILFSIPVIEASQDSSMLIDYSFDWERDAEGFQDSYSIHTVGYNFYTLLKNNSNPNSNPTYNPQ